MTTILNNLFTFNSLLSLISGVLWFFPSTTVPAADLTVTPITPVVTLNQTLTITVTGASGQVRWQAFDGKISGEGTQVTYLAPDKVGKDTITVVDSEGNTGVLKVVITPPNNFAPKNAQWEVFMNRGSIRALLLSDDGNTLWVETDGGLEKRNAQTGEMERIFDYTDGLPNMRSDALVSDNQGGLWVGTTHGELAHYLANGQWQIFNIYNSGSPLLINPVTTLISDGQSGLWVGTSGGLAHYTAQGQWQLFNVNNSGSPSDSINALQGDGQSGLWVGTERGLAHYTAQGQWQVVNTDNFGLSKSSVAALLSDGQGGVWVGTRDKGLAHYTAQGQWQVVNTNDSGLSNNNVRTLLSDGQGGLWIGTNSGGLAHYPAQGQWQIFNVNNSGLPSNSIGALQNDGQGGLWVGTWDKGLAHYTTQGQWQVFHTGNSDQLNNYALISLSDGQGGRWVGTNGGLAHYPAQGQQQVFNTDNSGLPDNGVRALQSDGQGGLWVGTSRGLAHYPAQGQWQVVDTSNVQALLSDGQGGLWIGTDVGLAYYTAQGQWQLFNTSGLPDDDIQALLSDGQGGLWIGTWKGGLAHYTAQGQWQIFNVNNSGLPSDSIDALQSDGQGGLWVGTWDKGLAHYPAQGQWQVFDTDNSGLRNNSVRALQSDGQGGLWIETAAGTVHLTFSRQTELCTQSQIDSATCQAIQQGQHAAIIVAAGGAQETNTLWESTEAITTHLYRTFYRRGFAKANLYYLSPKTWADFDGDGFNDRINRLTAERDLTLDDLEAAFTWAKSLGQLDQPLYFFFMDHGGEGKLQLSPHLQLTATKLKALLDDYQAATGNAMVAVIEACHSGSLLSTLTATKRAVIASAKGTEKAYFFENTGFLRFFADHLLKGDNLAQAFVLAARDQEKLLGNNQLLETAGSAGLTTQTPQLDDNQDGISTAADGNWLKQIYVNGQFTTVDDTLAVANLTPSISITAGQPFTLQAKATLTQGTVKRLWAVIRPPAIAKILDTNGTPILAFPRLELGLPRENSELWESTWQDAVYNGNYFITFYAEDHEKNIASSEQDTVLTVTGGIDPPSQAQLQVNLAQNRYQRGETFLATVTEELAWGYDLYIAVTLPDGQNFLTLKRTNELRSLNEAKPWYAPRLLHNPFTLLDFTLPDTLPTGSYCLYSILSPKKTDIFETLAKGLGVIDSQCFEIF